MREKPRKPVSVTKRHHPIPDGRLFGVGAATGGDRVSAEGKTGVRRQCAICSRSGRIASGITLRRLRGGASEALVPERRRCPPATVGALSGGTVAGETRRKGAQHSPVKEITTNTPLNGDILMKNKEEPRLSDAPCTCPYISGRERGSDAVIRKIAPFSRRRSKWH